jgi:recombinational DNA repair protein RecR
MLQCENCKMFKKADNCIVCGKKANDKVNKIQKIIIDGEHEFSDYQILQFILKAIKEN